MDSAPVGGAGSRPSLAIAPPDIMFRGRLWTSAELVERASAYRATLDRVVADTVPLVAMVMSNHVDAVALFFALSAGRVPVLLLPPDPKGWQTSPPVPTGTPLVLTPDVAALERHGLALGLAVTVMGNSQQPVGGPPPAFMSGPAVVFLTSGSTGAPRPVCRTLASLVAASSALARLVTLADEAAVLATLPLDRSFGMNNGLVLASLLRRTLGLLDRFDHNDVLDLCAERRYGYWAGTPVMADLLGRAARPGTHSVPDVCVFAGRLSARTFETFVRRYGVPLRQMYGTTETLTVSVDLAPADQVRFDTAGVPMPGVDVRIGASPDEPARPGESGRVWVRTPWGMTGYGFAPEQAGSAGSDTWWASPDVGLLDVEGRVTLTARTDDLVRSASGHILNPGGIARVLDACAGVNGSAVVAISNFDGGALGALVEGEASLRASELRAALARALPGWAQPRTVRVVERLPRLATGRVDRRACAVLLEAPAFAEERG